MNCTIATTKFMLHLYPAHYKMCYNLLGQSTSNIVVQLLCTRAALEVFSTMLVLSSATLRWKLGTR
jgi:hypothetical protein